MGRNSVPIPDFIYEILEKYFNGSGVIFNLSNNQVANRVLKEIAEDCKLTRKIQWKFIQGKKIEEEPKQLSDVLSFHFARYTYTRILDQSSLQGRDIQKNLGHKRFATTEGYLVSDDMRRIVSTFKVVSK